MLAWLILFIVVALIAFTTRLAAAEDDHLADGGELATEPLRSEAADSGGLAAEPSPSAAANSASFDPAWSDAGAADDREAARHRAPMPLGRVDLTITWRRTVRVVDIRGLHPDGAPSIHATASALDPVTTAHGVLWVLLTWSR